MKPRKKQASSSSLIDVRWIEFASFAVANLSDGAYLISKEGTVVDVNDAACRELGYSKEEMRGMSMLRINPTLTQENWDEIWEVTARVKKQTIETEHVTKDGRTVPVEVLANHMVYDGTEYSCAFARDITKRREMERRMRQSEKMEAIGQLAGGIAHDFNNQLTAIVACTDLLLDELSDRPALLHLAQSILTGAKRSAALTGQLLAFSRQGKYQAVPVDLKQIVEEVILILQRSLDKRIRIGLSVEGDSLWTIGDPSQLQNAVLNLAINARDAMQEGGELTISLSIHLLDAAFCSNSSFDIYPGRFIRITVTDTGCGIHPADKERIFEPFFTTKEKGKGTGMGLAAVYGTISSHKGAVAVQSDTERGTRMSLFLPITNKRTADEFRKPISASQVDAHVLLVEDEPLLLEMSEKMLRRLGCNVVTASSGIEAVAVYERKLREIDVVLLDLIMPDMGGRDTFLAIQKLRPDVKTIVTSGCDLDGNIHEILNRGAKAFIHKPFGIRELARTLSEVLAV